MEAVADKQDLVWFPINTRAYRTQTQLHSLLESQVHTSSRSEAGQLGGMPCEKWELAQSTLRGCAFWHSTKAEYERFHASPSPAMQRSGGFTAALRLLAHLCLQITRKDVEHLSTCVN